MQARLVRFCSVILVKNTKPEEFIIFETLAMPSSAGPFMAVTLCSTRVQSLHECHV